MIWGSAVSSSLQHSPLLISSVSPHTCGKGNAMSCLTSDVCSRPAFGAPIGGTLFSLQEGSGTGIDVEDGMYCR